ncbi:MAG: helix-turn-helix domain-containing protein [Polyangiaceae bacterium]|nr:helix-turn-helix domain-containing protein [Polyangiaceae bacterium]
MTTPAHRKPRFVTVQRAAELLGCCDHTVYRKIKDGSLPNTRRVMGGYLVEFADLEALAVPLDETNEISSS